MHHEIGFDHSSEASRPKPVSGRKETTRTMFTTSRLTDDQLHHVIHQMSAIDVGEWQPADIDRVLTEQGWQRRAEGAGSRILFSTGLPTGQGSACPDAGLDCVLSIPLAVDLSHAEATEVFRQARHIAEEILGPAPWLGGPGPWLRWRRPDTTPMLSFASYPADGTGWVYFQLLVTEDYEHGEYRGLVTPSPSWYRLVNTDAIDGLLRRSRQARATWKNLSERLAETLATLVHDTRLLGDHYPLTLLIEETNGEREPTEIPTCFIKLSAHVLSLECPAGHQPDVMQAMTELGWTPPSPANTAPERSNYHRDFPISSPDFDEAARLVAGAMRALGAEVPQMTYWVNRNGENTGIRLSELGLSQ
ncbi:hypothetical protein AB0K48_23470 [Nonomuraea sp. NPDC055795]